MVHLAAFMPLFTTLRRFIVSGGTSKISSEGKSEASENSSTSTSIDRMYSTTDAASTWASSVARGDVSFKENRCTPYLDLRETKRNSPPRKASAAALMHSPSSVF